MSEFDDFIKGIGSDIKAAAEKVGKKTEEAFEVSKRQAERMSIKRKIQAAYQKLGEEVYAGMKSGEDVSAEIDAIAFDLDSYFERIHEIYEEINLIKGGYVVEDDEMDWEEEYAEGYDEEIADEDDPEVEVEIIVEEEVPVEIETEEVEEVRYKEQPQEGAFDINID